MSASLVGSEMCIRDRLFIFAKAGLFAKGARFGAKSQCGRGAIKMAMVPRRRLELPRPNGHWHLKPARLPIPPPGLAIDLAKNRSLTAGVRITTNNGVSNLFNGLMARKCGFYCRHQMLVKIYFMGNWHWWDCKAGKHDLSATNECMAAIWTRAVSPV